MRRRVRQWLVAIATVVVIISGAAVSTMVTATSVNQVSLGAYDPAQAFLTTEAVTIDHHFVTWRLDNTAELEIALNQATQSQRFPLITLESWPWNWNNMTAETLLWDIAAGKYDTTLTQVFQTIQQYAPQTVLLRWGHEMEIVNQYPWSKSEANDYIAAYRHIVDLSRVLGIKNILWLWSPAGNKNADDYWPGEDYVDYVGVSIYAIKEWNPHNPNRLPSFKQLMSQKYWLSRRYNRPLIVAEVGVAGSLPEKEEWIAQAIEMLPRFPRIQAWVYFNQIQPDIVPLDIGQPHWQLSSQEANHLVTQWQQVYPEPIRFLEK